ncbi:MAG: 1-deoxy-D-xylulose-5-phosphate synthase [Clostridiales bacterium]|nr:1-deoxy-D-xylulose-5-phosphate synthase [Clostridiales bacterium]
MKLLENINSPSDLKKLTDEETDLLCSEIRELIIKTVSENGGHLASNLGTVELSVAMHKVFSAPDDNIIFDVGHQSYTHKILTGRRERFATLRQEGGISGFTRPQESEYDIFSSGHSSVSVSQALGLAKAKELNGEKGKVVVMIGDGALTGGLAYEGLNNVNLQNSNLIVILNDNKMSIAKNVGLVSKHLTSVRTSKNYFAFRSKIRRTIAKAGSFGKEINKFIALVNTAIRKRVYKDSTFFEDLGFRYYGPIDGHDMKSLVAVLETAKAHSHPVLIDVVTVKGKGYKPAETDPTRFHGIGKFNIETGESAKSGKTFSSVFGKTISAMAAKDSKICCITAAMAYGTGLDRFAKKFPKRFFDVGIAEQHAVTFASGLAKGGMVPVFAVYSTFLQRSYDQLIHDCAMQRLKIIFAIDRAGFVGEDGESHQGLFDVSYLNTVPGLTVYSPSCFDDLSSMLKVAVYTAPGASAVRYPRGSQGKMPENYRYSGEDFTVYEAPGSEKNVIITYGREFCECYKAYKKLSNTALIKLNKIKPLNMQLLKHIEGAENIYFYEESIKSGGVGEELGSLLAESGIKANYKITGVDSGLVKEASVERQLQMYGLDYKNIIKEVSNGGKDKA